MSEELPFNKAEMDNMSSNDSEYHCHDYINEPLNASNEEDAYHTRCYWFGEMVFKATLAEALFRSHAPARYWNDLNSELMQAFIEFPYGEFIEKLDALKSSEVPSGMHRKTRAEYAIFMTKTGAVLDKGESGIRNKLVALIQSRGESTKPLDYKLPPSPPSSVDGDADDEKRIAMFTMKLNEWCLQQNKQKQPFSDQLSLHPPRWEAKLLIDGSTYFGRAKKKQTAFHIAAKQACEQLIESE